MNLNSFISQFLKRNQTLFFTDIDNHKTQLIENIENKNVLVIGGAGTIGYSFIKALLNYKPRKLVVVDNNENSLTELVRDLRSTHNQFIPKEFYTYPTSLGSSVFSKIFKVHGSFDIVANFAAHKHVRSEKDIFSITALLENNIIRAKGLLDLLVSSPPKHFFCVSTDKAANPVNIMGASKKLMEDLIFSYSNFFKVSTARFANVAFSNGSLLEGFLSRINKLQPIACPTDVKRFFVTPEESGQICLMACVIGKSNEIFFPKLYQHDMINFFDFLDPLLLEFGYTPEFFSSDIEAKASMRIVEQNKYPVYLFKTDTSGEKLYEEFFTESEIYDMKKFNTLGVISKHSNYSHSDFNLIIAELENLLVKEDVTKLDIIHWLNNYVKDFRHIETGLGLDGKM